VLGCGAKNSTSDLLIANCDEFIYYDDLIRAARKAPAAQPKKEKEKTEVDKKQEATQRVLELLETLEQDYDPLWGSMLKQAIRRVYPGFSEGYYGYRSFSDLLEEIQKQGMIQLEWEEGRGNYKVRRKS
jgi:hypothetical protein